MKRCLVLLIALNSALIFADCRNLSIIVRLGDRPYCYQGHAGIGVDDEYYDWGPGDASDLRVYTIGAPGTPFEDKNQVPKKHKDRAKYSTLTDIRNFYKNGANECATYEFQGKITPEQAKNIAAYWEWIYNVKKPYFHYAFASQCTKTVCRSLKGVGLMEKVLWRPSSLYKLLESGAITSSCGQQAGQKLKKTKLHD